MEKAWNVGRVKWFTENYCKGCGQECPVMSEPWIACVLTNILFELIDQNGEEKP